MSYENTVVQITEHSKCLHFYIFSQRIQDSGKVYRKKRGEKSKAKQKQSKSKKQNQLKEKQSKRKRKSILVQIVTFNQDHIF